MAYIPRNPDLIKKYFYGQCWICLEWKAVSIKNNKKQCDDHDNFKVIG